MASAVSAYKLSFGSDGPPGSYADLAENFVLLIGHDLHPHRRSPHAFPARVPFAVLIILGGVSRTWAKTWVGSAERVLSSSRNLNPARVLVTPEGATLAGD